MSLSFDNLTNLTAPMAMDLCKSHPYFIFGEIIWRIGALICVLLGMPSHAIIIAVMLNFKNRRQPICLYFTTISIFESIYLISKQSEKRFWSISNGCILVVFWSWCSSLSLVRDPREVLSCGTYYSLTIGSSNISTLLLTAASIDRVLIVVYPSRSSNFVTQTKVLIKIFIIIIGVSLLIIQYHFSFYFSYSFYICDYYSYAELWHGKVWPLIRLSLLAFLPCIITCLCSVVILRNRYYRRPSTTSETSGSRHMRTASLLLVIYSIYYTLSVMPMNVLQFFHSSFFPNDLLMGQSTIDCSKFSQWKLLMKFCKLLLAVNYSNKFLVHYLISLQFRRDFWRLFTHCYSVPYRYDRRGRSRDSNGHL